MSILKEGVDYKYLEEELYKALKEDELYKLQNEAKIRAVEQRVPTYNHFREMVNGAHLKSLDKNDIKNRIPIPMNSFANRPENLIYSPIVRNTESETPLSKTEENIQKSVPKDTKEFMSRWKRTVDPISKFEYLLNTRTQLEKKIFLTEVPNEFLEEVIDLCLSQLSNGKIRDMIDLLSILSRCNRFQLTLIFLPKEKKIILKRLLQELISGELKECEELKDTYKMILK